MEPVGIVWYRTLSDGDCDAIQCVYVCVFTGRVMCAANKFDFCLALF